MPTVRLQAPEKARPGEIVEVKALVQHPMESGFRRDARGQPIPRKILNKVTVTFEDELVLEGDWFIGVAASPFLAFDLRVERAGTLRITWRDDDGTLITAQHRIELA